MPRPRVETHVLSDGLTVLLDRMPTEGVSVAVDSRMGAWDEEQTAAGAGAAHFLEHMMFRGTLTRPNDDVKALMEGRGGALNAWTGSDWTSYHVDGLSEDAPFFLEVLTDMTSHPRLSEEDLRTESGVIVQEIAESEEDPSDLVNGLWDEAAMPGHPLSRHILGTTESVSGMQVSTLSNFHLRAFSRENVVVSLAGNFNDDAVMRACETGFLPRKQTEAVARREPVFVQCADRRSHANEFDQLHVVLGCTAPDPGVPGRIPLLMSALILGGGLSSRLHAEIRERRGLAYSVGCWCSDLRGGSSFNLYVATDGERGSEAVLAMLSEVRRLASDVPLAEVEKARNQMRVGLLRGLDAPYSRRAMMVNDLRCLGRVRTVEETLDAVTACGPDAVRQALAGVLVAPWAMAAVGKGCHLLPEDGERMVCLRA